MDVSLNLHGHERQKKITEVRYEICIDTNTCHRVALICFLQEREKEEEEEEGGGGGGGGA